MQRNEQYVELWLIVLAALIFSIVILGGYTRLSGSGLSIVSWQPVSGILPPLNHHQWLEVFDQYKLSPEFCKINYDMDLSNFQFIFIIEFLHRLLARIIGLVMIIPLAYFYYIKAINKQQLAKYLLMILILSFQGFIGWYMVKSGLVNNPYVSHYRLSTHLIIAIGLYSFIFYQLFPKQENNKLYHIKPFLYALLLLLYGQIFMGAMVAGLKAGLVYNTFPLMGDGFIPYEINLNDFNDPVTVQFIHRILAYLLTTLCFYVSYMLYCAHMKYLAWLLFGICLLQGMLGVLTLLYMVQPVLALLHQGGSIVLISVVIYCLKMT